MLLESLLVCELFACDTSQLGASRVNTAWNTGYGSLSTYKLATVHNKVATVHKGLDVGLGLGFGVDGGGLVKEVIAFRG